MEESTNRFFEVARQWQQQWTEAISDMQKAAMVRTPAFGEMNPGSFIKVWSEGMQSVMELGAGTNGNRKKAQAALLGMGEQFKQVSSTYVSVMELWSKMLKGGNGDHPPEAHSEERHFWLEKMLEPMAEFASPKAVPGLIGSEAVKKASAEMFDNWMAFWSDLVERAGEGLSSEEAQEDMMRRFYESWLKRYETTIGRFVKFNAVGPARVELEKLSRSTDAYLKYQAASAEFQNMMLTTGMETLQEVMDSSEDLFKEEVTEESFDRFYQLMVNIGERRYHELFSAPLFCQSLESLINTGLEFQQAASEIAEEALKKTPIVTQSQVDEMHREIYLLKKRVAELERREAERNGSGRGDV